MQFHTDLNAETRRLLEDEIPILRAEIQALYRRLDLENNLKGASLPIEFGYDEEKLGSYTPESEDEKEHFFFSLSFIGYCLTHQISKSDREDLYKHEYAHYMTRYVEIPKEYRWQSGPHGSAWKYCCSLVGATPSPTYRIGQSLVEHDYEKSLKNPIHDKSIPIRDRYRQEKKYQHNKNSNVQYKIGETVTHPKFGEGKIIDIEPVSGAVRLTIEFKDGIKKIDQKWLLKTKYQRVGDRLNQ